MKRITKKAFGFVVVFAVVATTCISCLAAQIEWDPFDLYTPVIYEATFDDGKAAVAGGALDTETFASDPDHGIVTASTGYLRAASGAIGGFLTENSKITVEFDYYSTTQDNLRVELRNLAASEPTGANQQPFWDATQDLPYMSVTNDGWHRFKGTVDLSKYYPYLLERNDKVSFTNAYIFIRLSNSGQLYTDNYNIYSAETTVLPLVEPSITFDSNVEEISDSDPIASGHKNVGKTSLTGGSQTNIITGTAPGFFIDNRTYALSLNYYQAEEPESSVTKTDLTYLRFKNGNYTVVNLWSGGHNYTLINDSVNKWINVKRTLTIDPEHSEYSSKMAPLVKSGKFSFTIQSNIDVSDFYIADIKLLYVPQPSSNTVAFEEEQNVSFGESCTINVGGYFDETVSPTICIDGKDYSGQWVDVALGEDGKYRTGKAYFEELTADKFPEYNDAQLEITDIWGSVKTNPVRVVFTTDVTQRLEVLSGAWETFYDGGDEKTVTNGIDYSPALYIKENAQNGKTLYRFSFDVKGQEGIDYSSINQGVAFRTGSGLELRINIDKEKLSTGEYESYSIIADIGSMNRYYWNYKVIDRINEKYNVMLRSAADKPVTYKNVKVEVFNPDASSKDSVVGRLKIENNADASFSPNGKLIIAEYNGSQLLDLHSKSVNFSNDGDLLNGVSKDETKYIYITGNETGDVKLGISDSLKAFNPNNTYKVFYWNGLNNPVSITNSAKLN